MADSVNPSTLQLQIKQIRWEATDIYAFELVHPQGQALPAFSAGAHIDVHIGDGLIRQYSLSNDPQETHRYVIGVLRDEAGRGGSRAFTGNARVGQMIQVSTPRNNFALAANAQHTLLLAGGIGITPLKSMAHALSHAGSSFALHYCVRSDDRIAFQTELAALPDTQCHVDGGDPSQGLNIAALLATPQEGTHVYFCGPPGFMKACKAATAHWPAAQVHSEHFQAPVADAPASPNQAAGDGSFVAQIASTGQTIAVAAHQSLVDALAGEGIEIATSCISGLCGTCKVGYVSGDVEHNDHILGADEQSQCLTACVSRARSGVLVLEL